MSNLINKETGIEIAAFPENLPPLREGYVRLIHQTNFNCAESFAENGLIYNRNFAQKEGGGNYTDITSMAVAYVDENAFWERLTAQEIRHKGANAIAIFDMPMAECKAHQTYQITPMLNGTISRGYMVGMIPNYGTKDSETGERLSVSEMEEKRHISKSNPLPPFYETPDWRENVENAQKALQEQSNDTDRHNPLNLNRQSNSDKDNTAFETDDTDWGDWGDFEDGKEADTSFPSPTPEYIFNGQTEEFNYKNPKVQEVSQAAQRLAEMRAKLVQKHNPSAADILPAPTEAPDRPQEKNIDILKLYQKKMQNGNGTDA